MTNARIVLILAAAVLGVLPSTASGASTVSLSGRALTITGSAGKDNISVNYRDYGSPQGVTVADQTGVTPGAGCVASSSTGTEAVCSTAKPAAGNQLTAAVTLGGGDDGYANYLDGVADTVDGGDGNDEIDGRVAGDSVVRATDLMNGGEGNDDLGAGSGPGTTCNGGGGDDNIVCFYVETGVVVNGGPGRDTVQGGNGPDQINGDSGDDPSLQGLKGNDVIHGGDGDDGSKGVSDLLAGGEGADQVFGDAGVDRVVEDRNQDRKQFWSLDDQANDGADLNDTGGADEGDNIHSDVENVTGGYDDDTIVGSAANNTLHGGTLGNDTVVGLAGNDNIFTGISGDGDSADGGAGNDKVQGNGSLKGGAGNDELTGQSGNDVLDAGAGLDSVSAGAGNDIVKTTDGQADQVGCGVGGDVAQVDSIDVVDQDPGDLCETLKVTTIAVTVSGSGTFRRNVASFSLKAPGAGTVASSVKPASGRSKPILGKATKRVTKAGRTTLQVKLTHEAAKALLRKQSFAVTLTTRFTASGTSKAGAARSKRVVLKKR